MLHQSKFKHYSRLYLMFLLNGVDGCVFLRFLLNFINAVDALRATHGCEMATLFTYVA